MKFPLRTLRTGMASVAIAGVLLAGGGVALAPHAFANYGTIKATTAVNVRSQPSTKGAVLGVLYLGATVKQTGPVKNGWVPISYGGRSAWVAADYLTGVRATADAPTSQSGAKGTKKATANLNVRSGPSLNSGVIGLLQAGTTVTLTGTVSGQYSQISYRDQRAWVATAYLGSGASTPDQIQNTTQARATADLMIRTSSGSNFTSLGDIAKGTVVNLTGKKTNGVSEIIWQGAKRWVNSNYLASVNSNTTPTGPSVPKVTGTQYATTALDIRTSAGSDAKTVTEVPRGTALSITGVVRTGRAQIVYQGVARWVTAKYLSASKPSTNTGSGAGPNSSGLSGLRPQTQVVLSRTLSKFPQVTTYYGVRPDSIPDHPRGFALDIMIPQWNTSGGEALGWEIANYLRANAKELGIQYIIHGQKIWNVARDKEGWRWMADRGSATANHYDHVHVTTVGM